MGACSNRVKGGLTLAFVCIAIGVVRLMTGTGPNGWLTWVWFPLAAVYVLAAATVWRYVDLGERAEDRLGRRERTDRTTARAAGPTWSPGRVTVVGHRVEVEDGSTMVTKNRVANALATLAAIVGIVLVVTGAGQKDDDDTPSTPPPAGSQVAPAAPGQNQPTLPASLPPAVGQPPAPAAGQPQPSAPAQKKDDDGDDDN